MTRLKMTQLLAVILLYTCIFCAWVYSELGTRYKRVGAEALGVGGHEKINYVSVWFFGIHEFFYGWLDLKTISS